MNNIRKNIKITSLLTVFVLLVALSVMIFNFILFINSPASSKAELRQVNIPSGLDVDNISRLLFDSGIISSRNKFKLYVRLRKADARLKAGEYQFTTFMSPRDVLEKLLKGERILKKITVPEGFTMRQVAGLMAEHHLGSYEEILALMKNRDFIKELGIDAPTLEGYLFPDTYLYSSTQGPRDIIKEMVRQFNEHFEKIWENRAPDNPLSRYEILILASMVEKEAMVDEERPLIAGVFMNRLKKGMLLQCDPTVIYGLEKFNGKLTRKDLASRTPYNTYLVKGLPPGPICNPGLSSLKAAANPAPVKYLFFVSKNNGHHYFSENIRDHINAVRKYQRRRH